MPKKITALALILALPAAAAGQRRALTLEEAVGLGLRNSPGLHASEMAFEAAAAKAREASADLLPSLKFGGGYTRLSEVPPFVVSLPLPPPYPSEIEVSPVFFDNVSLRLSLQQPLFTGFRLQAGREAALLQRNAAGEDKERDRADFILDVKTAYWGLVRARQLIGVIDENLTQIDAHLKDVRAFFGQGLVTRNEVLRVEVQRANVEVMKLEAETSDDIALTRLVSLLGLPRGTDIEPTSRPDSAAAGLSGPGEAPPERDDQTALVESALAARPDLKSADFRIGAAAAGVKAARSGWYPQVYFSGNYSYLRPNPRLMPTQGRFYGTWDLSVSLSLDIWNWGRTRHQADRAEAALAQARDARRILEDQAVLEITQNRLGVSRAGQRVRVSAEAIGLAEENLRVARERFRQGMALNSDVLDAELALLQARLNRTQAAIDFALAEARLEKALGR